MHKNRFIRISKNILHATGAKKFTTAILTYVNRKMIHHITKCRFCYNSNTYNLSYLLLKTKSLQDDEYQTELPDISTPKL